MSDAIPRSALAGLLRSFMYDPEEGVTGKVHIVIEPGYCLRLARYVGLARRGSDGLLAAGDPSPAALFRRAPSSDAAHRLARCA